MKFSESLKKNAEFRNVYKKGASFANRFLVMYILPNCTNGNRLGISVSKKVGNSVVRHRVTRLIRECFRLNKERLAIGLDIVVVARAAAAVSDYKIIECAFLHLCGLHNIFQELK